MNKEFLEQIENATSYDELKEIIDAAFQRVYKLGHGDGSKTAQLAAISSLTPVGVVPAEPISRADLLTAIQAAEDELGLTRSPDAERFLLAIAYQESAWRWRKQVLSNGTAGPARGYWQFEKMGGVLGVMTHSRTRVWANAMLDRRGITQSSTSAWEALATDNILAAGFARLLVLSDPNLIPTSKDTAWDYYLRTWRPGKPHRERWDAAWKVSAEVSV